MKVAAVEYRILNVMGKMLCASCHQVKPFEYLRWDNVHKRYICHECREVSKHITD